MIRKTNTLKQRAWMGMLAALAVAIVAPALADETSTKTTAECLADKVC